MSLKATFTRYVSSRMAGMPQYSLELKNTNWIQSETVDLLLSDAYGRRPWYLRNREIKAGEALIINPDTEGWEWCQGDYCASLGKKDRIKERWTLNLKIYGPGECPDCHGTHKCRYCNGQGYPFNPRNPEIMRCPYCGGTGTCYTCYIPERRTVGVAMSTSAAGPANMPNGRNTNMYNSIMAQISDLQSKIQKIDWDLKMMQLNGTEVSSHSVYTTYLQLKYSYQKQLIELQSRL